MLLLNIILLCNVFNCTEYFFKVTNLLLMIKISSYYSQIPDNSKIYRKYTKYFRLSSLIHNYNLSYQYKVFYKIQIYFKVSDNILLYKICNITIRILKVTEAKLGFFKFEFAKWKLNCILIQTMIITYIMFTIHSNTTKVIKKIKNLKRKLDLNINLLQASFNQLTVLSDFLILSIVKCFK